MYYIKTILQVNIQKMVIKNSSKSGFSAGKEKKTRFSNTLHRKGILEMA